MTELYDSSFISYMWEHTKYLKYSWAVYVRKIFMCCVMNSRNKNRAIKFIKPQYTL